MVKLRLRRKGRKAHAIYDVVAVDGRARRDGAFLERLGWYDPHQKPGKFEISHEKTIKWLNNGAQPTEVVQLLLSYDGVLLRRHLEFKKKTADEIEAMVAKHKAVTAARYERRANLRVKRKEEKVKAEAKAKAEAN